MRSITRNIVTGTLAIAMISACITACKKIEDPEAFVPERVFTPSAIAATGGETSATIVWRASLFSGGSGQTYTVQVSGNADFSGTPVYTTQTDTVSITLTDAQLQLKTNYYARVKGNATANSAESAGWVATTTAFQITGEQLFLPVADDDLTANTAILKWKPSTGLTKIVLTPAGGTAVDYALSPAEITASQKQFTGLTQLKQYTAELFKGAVSKGTVSFTTKTDRPTGPGVVIVAPTDNLATLLTTAAPGAIFVLEQNALYSYDDPIVLPENASFTIWGDNGPNKPVLAFNGITLPATAGTIRFENVDFTGYQNNLPATKRNYIFNQSTASNTQAIIFENCIVRNFTNTPLRLQGSAAITINKVTFNKCLSYDIGDNGTNGTYAFVHNNVATSKINTIELTNSTFYKIGYSIILHNAAPSQSVLIENRTFDNSLGNGRYFVDYNAQTIGSFQITNTIIGKTLSPAATARGVRPATAIVTNSFQTTDAVFAGNAITGINAYTGSSTDLFTNPSAGNFLIKDNNFTGKSNSGDPRWRL